jgi:hypothetical protein
MSWCRVLVVGYSHGKEIIFDLWNLKVNCHIHNKYFVVNSIAGQDKSSGVRR